jgi:uncharacterized Zn finger protein (UPF0148 family)
VICRCGAPLADGFTVCAACGESLAYALAEVDGVVEVLDQGVARTGLTAGYGERVSSSGSLHAPLPINEAVFDARHALHTYLMRTALKLAETTGPLTGRTSQGLAAYLLVNLDVLRRMDWAPTVEAELRGHLRHGHDRVNKAEGKVFAGQCANCDTDLYAGKQDAEARCRTCGATYEVLKWRAHAETAKNYYIGTAADLSRKLSAPQYGYTITADQIRKWALRDKIERANPETDEAGSAIPPAYRLGDVLALNLDRYQKHPINGAA